MQREVTGELDELVVASDEVGLTVDLHQRADLVPRVDVALDDSLARLGASALCRLRLATRAQHLDRLLHVPGGLGQRLATREYTCSRSIPQSFDVVGGDLGHFVSWVPLPCSGAEAGSAPEGLALDAVACVSVSEARWPSGADSAAASSEAASAAAASSSSRCRCSSASRRARSSASWRSPSWRARSSSALKAP